MMRKVLFGVCLLLMIALAGCMRSQSSGTEYTVFVPPTLVATAVKTPTMNPITPVPAAVDRDCIKGLSYVDDVTVPDGTYFVPGAPVVKTWKVENSGTCRWTGRYTLRHIDGNAMEASPKQELVSIAPGTEGEITIEFTAPEVAGYYYSGWQAYDDLGKSFGDEIYMEIYVDPYADTYNQQSTQGGW